MAVVDILKFIITGDNTGLKAAAAESDALMKTMSGGIASGLSTMALRFAGIAAGAVALAAVMRNTVGEAVESERVFKQLGAAVEASGESWRQLESRIREAATELQKFSVFTDEEVGQALTVLIQSGMDSAQALSLIQTAADGASASGQSLAEVARIIGLAFQGSGRGARQLGIVLDDTGDKTKILSQLVDKMQKRFAGRALVELQTTAGAWQNFGKQLKEVGETIGNFLLEPLAKMLGLVNQLIQAAREGKDVVDFFNAIFRSDAVNAAKAAREANRLAAMKSPLSPFAPPSGPIAPIKTPSTALQEAEVSRIRLAALKERIAALNAAGALDAQYQKAAIDGLEQIIAEERKRFAQLREMGESTYGEELDFLEKIRESAEASGLDELALKVSGIMQDLTFEDVKSRAKQNLAGLTNSLRGVAKQSTAITDDTIAAQKEGFNQLISNAHRLASEFGRFMSEAVANFIHNAIQGIRDIKSNLGAIKAGGIGAIGGALGLASAAFGIIGSFVDVFFKGSEKIFKSNVEVVQAIQNWISSLRSQTKEELVAGRKDIEAGRKALKEAAGFSGDLLKKNSDEFIASLSDSSFKQTFAAAAEQFKRTTGRRGSVEEVLAFMEQQLIKQERLFDALIGGKVKSPDDVRKLLKEQTRLDAQTGRQWIEFIAKQNNWTPAERKALFEELFNTLADSGNASVQELMALRETIDALEEGTANISEEGDKQIQITRSVASITEGQANLVVGHLQTLSSVAQAIYELMQNALTNFTNAAAGLTGVGAGVVFEAGSIVINSSATNGTQLAEDFRTDLRAKGIKV